MAAFSHEEAVYGIVDIHERRSTGSKERERDEKGKLRNEGKLPFFAFYMKTHKINPKNNLPISLPRNEPKPHDPILPKTHVSHKTNETSLEQHLPISPPICPTKNHKTISFFFGLGLACKPSHFPWIFYCGDADNMTFDPSNLLTTVPTPQTHIQTANGEYVSVEQAGSVDISPSLHFKKFMLVPSLSHKLLSFSQLTKELNCTVLFTLDGCIV